MEKLREDETELSTKGKYLGQCRQRFNILEQWEGRKWVRVPDVRDRTPARPSRIHFDVEDALHD